MRRNFLKFCLVGLGSIALLSACVEADNLDSIEQLQDVTAKAKLDAAKTEEASNRLELADKVYEMQTDVATLKSEILGLQLDSNQIQFIIKDTQASISADSATSVANNQVIAKLTAATSVDYNTVINGLYNDVKTSYTALENSKLAYDNALDAYNIAGAKANNSAKKYADALAQKDSAAIDTANALSGFTSRQTLTLKINRSNALVATYTSSQNKFKASVDALLTPLNTASAAKDKANSDLLTAQAVVDNDALMGITNSAHNSTLNTASKASNTADTTYTSAKGKYDSAALSFDGATDDLRGEQTTYNQLVKLASDYDVAKAIYTTANNSLPALLAEKNADSVAYDNLAPAKENTATAKAIAQATYDANNSALNIVKADKATLTTAIAAIRASENATQKSLQKNGDILIQLSTQSYDLVKIVKDVIAAKQEKIKALEAIIASYKI